MVKAQRQIGITLLEAVDLFFRLSAALGQQDVRRLDHRRSDGRKAVKRKGFSQDFQHPLKFLLRCGQQLHKAGEGSRFQFFHCVSSLL